MTVTMAMITVAMMMIVFAMFVVMVMIVVTMFVAMVMRLRRRRVGKGKAMDGNAAAGPLAQARLSATRRHHGAKIGKNSLAQRRQRIQHRGDEHVARHAADCVEMDVARLSHDRQRLGRHRAPRE
jgi:flagellar biosynthesis/type III secretory pathway M-ring protein FliF/YscJ